MHSDLPKVLHRLAGRPLLAHVIATARELAPQRICVVYGHGGEVVRQAIADETLGWAKQEQHAGRYVCFAVVPEGMQTAIGIFQVRQLDPTFETAEWGFALGKPFWGTGVFMTSARQLLDFAFETIGVHRLEARAAIANGRGNGALAKLGALKEGVLRRSFLRGGEYHDQALWSIVRDDWDRARATRPVSVH